MDSLDNHIETRSPEQNSWGALIAIVVIMAIVVVGAFYAWGKRVAQEQRAALTGVEAAVDTATTTVATTTRSK